MYRGLLTRHNWDALRTLKPSDQVRGVRGVGRGDAATGVDGVTLSQVVAPEICHVAYRSKSEIACSHVVIIVTCGGRGGSCCSDAPTSHCAVAEQIDARVRTGPAGRSSRAHFELVVTATLRYQSAILRVGHFDLI